MNAGFLEIINHGQEEKIRLLQNKVDLYSANLEQYKQKSYNETQVRVDFVNSFFQLLGWDVLNENGLPQHLREVTHEATSGLLRFYAWYNHWIFCVFVQLDIRPCCNTSGYVT